MDGGARELYQGTITVSLGETEENHGKPQNNGPSSVSKSCKSKFLLLELVYKYNIFNVAKWMKLVALLRLTFYT